MKPADSIETQLAEAMRESPTPPSTPEDDSKSSTPPSDVSKTTSKQSPKKNSKKKHKNTKEVSKFIGKVKVVVLGIKKMGWMETLVTYIFTTIATHQCIFGS